VIEVLVIAAAQIQHRVKSVYMDYLLDVPPAGPPFQHLVARGVGASPAWPGVFRKTLFYPRRLQTERVPKPAKRGFFLLITYYHPMDELAWPGGTGGAFGQKNGVFRKNVGIPHIYRWVWYLNDAPIHGLTDKPPAHFQRILGGALALAQRQIRLR
jgi:hypothetical protein